MSTVAHPAKTSQPVDPAQVETQPVSPSIAPPSPFPDPIPNIIPYGSICLLAGATGVGKTAMLAEWAARFRDGRTICQRQVNRPTSIGFITGDRRWNDHQKWFNKVGFPDIPHYSFRDDRTVNWTTAFHSRESCQRTLRMVLDRLQVLPGGLVCVDPFALFIPGNQNDYKTCAAGIAMIDRVMLDYQITMIGLAHMGKQKANAAEQYARPQDRILGSTALLAFSDTPMYLLASEDAGDDAFELGWTPHHAPAQTFHFRRDTRGLFIPLMSDAEVQDTTRKLLPLVPTGDEGIQVREIVDQAHETLGFSRATVYRHLRLLESQGYIKRVRGVLYRKTVQ